MKCVLEREQHRCHLIAYATDKQQQSRQNIPNQGSNIRFRIQTILRLIYKVASRVKLWFKCRLHDVDVFQIIIQKYPDFGSFDCYWLAICIANLYTHRMYSKKVVFNQLNLKWEHCNCHGQQNPNKIIIV